VARTLIVDLPVADLPASVGFFTELGFAFRADLTDDTASAMIVNEDAMILLFTRARYRELTGGESADPRTHPGAFLAFSADRREQVDELLGAALARGGTASGDPEDHGFLYGRSFRDPDGHAFQVVRTDPAGYAG